MFDAVNKFFTTLVMGRAVKPPYSNCFKFIKIKNIVEEFVKNNADLEYI
jgi:hypothetical protein